MVKDLTKSNNNNGGEELCFICAHPTKFWAIAPCEHRICSLCCLRLRGLYNNKACTMCKVEHAYVHITSLPHLGFASTKAVASDEALGMMFESAECKMSVMSAMRLSCPYKGCKTILTNKNDLRRHVNTVHTALLCDICVTHKKAFSFELAVYDNKAALLVHQRDAKAGHPMCKICRAFFYSEDELATHCRERHEPCHICLARKRRLHPTQRTTSSAAFEQDHYHADYLALEEHFQREHFVCRDPICLEAKFVVFENELELKAHMAQVHMDKKLQRSQQRHLQRLDGAFLPSSSAPNQRRPTSNRDVSQPQTANAPTPPHVPQPPPQAVQDSSKFFFPPAGSIQTGSWSLLEGRNEELSVEFSKLHLETASIKALCREYQASKLTARDLIARLHQSLGTELFHKVLPKLVDLQDNPMKKQELAHAYKQQMDKIHAFPPLPHTPIMTSLPPGSALPRSVVKTHGPPIKGRIVHSKPATRPATDPSKNPLALLPGFSTNKAKTQGGPSKPRPVSRDDQEYPSLSPPKSSASPTSASAADLDEDCFVIGGEQPSSANDANAETVGKKKKWKPVLHIGL